MRRLRDARTVFENSIVTLLPLCYSGSILPTGRDGGALFKLSPYSIGIYEQCPRRYKHQYVDGLTQKYRKPWPWLTMGSHVHTALTRFLRDIPVEERTVETIESLLRNSWRRNREGFTDAEQEREYGERALAQVRWFASTQKTDVEPLMLERFHEAPVSENVVLMGRIDRIDRHKDGGLHVIDYKTGKVPENPDTFQLLQYAVILARTLPYPVTQASYLYLEDGEWRTFSIDPVDVQKTRGAVLAIAKRIERETEYREVVGTLCKYCDFLEICEAGRQSIS